MGIIAGTEEQRSERIAVLDNELVFDRENKPPVKIVVNDYIYVGCHRLTKDAWKLLKEKIDGEVK